jgi:hypothetical protein
MWQEAIAESAARRCVSWLARHPERGPPRRAGGGSRTSASRKISPRRRSARRRRAPEDPIVRSSCDRAARAGHHRLESCGFSPPTPRTRTRRPPEIWSTPANPSRAGSGRSGAIVAAGPIRMLGRASHRGAHRDRVPDGAVEEQVLAREEAVAAEPPPGGRRRAPELAAGDADEHAGSLLRPRSPRPRSEPRSCVPTVVERVGLREVLPVNLVEAGSRRGGEKAVHLTTSGCTRRPSSRGRCSERLARLLGEVLGNEVAPASYGPWPVGDQIARDDHAEQGLRGRDLGFSASR